ncbi:nucleosome assembly protein 1-like 1 [Eurytemora carolleeae]|uniref:nucleosome assembly protein 1-like 1 n=1 Tax=Eurytemora carolleeae TaxID=1294199 RepID=UPI000C77742F|nr:nucleosome assembly protein 1-like 1 [Eurytemora carolleeae]|eukprot:XP_023348414.1 nucleosome assembly protein 1-like 1 [Eurytemora affinis]
MAFEIRKFVFLLQAESDYYREVHQLDLKYQKVYDEINKKRASILAGEYEPSGPEIEWEDEEEDDEEKLTNGVKQISINGMDENTKGIPKFWMYAMKNANEDALMGMVEPHDEPVLEYLKDLTVTLKEPGNSGFTLNFVFSENPYFSNSVLTKEYKLREGPDPESPLDYDGPEIISCSGCEIDWKTGKDVTKTTVKVKKVKPRKGGKGSPEKDLTKVHIKIFLFIIF